MYSTSVIIITTFLIPLVTAVPQLPLSYTPTVRVQIDGFSELARLEEIPLNTLTPFPGDYADGFITDLEVHVGVACQAYSDKAGTEEVGASLAVERFITRGWPKFDGGEVVHVKNIKCS